MAPDQLHGARALEDAVILDIFTPQREDSFDIFSKQFLHKNPDLF